jgi:hypothetical protein
MYESKIKESVRLVNELHKLILENEIGEAGLSE